MFAVVVRGVVLRECGGVAGEGLLWVRGRGGEVALCG